MNQQKKLGQGETDKLQNKFDLFKEGLSDIINKDNDENTGSGCIGGGRGGGDDGTPPRPPPPDVFGGNTPAESSRRIAQANDERFQNRILREREREIPNIPRGIVKSRRSTILHLQLHIEMIFFPQPTSTPRETSFLFPESLSPLRNRLPNILQDHLLIILQNH